MALRGVLFVSNVAMSADAYHVDISCLDLSNTRMDELVSNFEQGQTYRGDVNITRSGVECQRWDEQLPHQHDRNQVRTQ